MKLSEDRQDIIVEMLKELSKRMDRLEEGFQRQYTELSRRMDRLGHNQEKTDDMVRDIWKSRDKVRAQVTWDFIWKAVAVNGVVLFAAGSLLLR
jgi:hypothetical protein